MKKILIRTATGLVYIALILIATLCGPYAFLSIFSIIAALGIAEMLKLCTKDEKPSVATTVIDILGGMAFFILSFSHYFPDFSVINPLWAGIGYMLLRGTMQLYDKRRNAIRQLSASYMAMFLVVFPLSLLSKLYLEANGHTTLLACLIFIWMNDTGAFCVGSLIGRHRLFERISPKKSWEGFWGGLIVVLLASQGFAWYAPEISRIQWLGLAAVVVLFATWGDLTESLLKRTLGVKDSGNLLPGHGGILDRFDSVLMATPAAYIYIELFIRN